jgi:hypothetical protein
LGKPPKVNIGRKFVQSGRTDSNIYQLVLLRQDFEDELFVPDRIQRFLHDLRGPGEGGLLRVNVYLRM